MKHGYIKLHRQIQDCWVWLEDKPFSVGQAWIDILLSCNHADKKTAFDGKPIVVQRGEWITSIVSLAERWGWGRKKVSNFLNVLENDLMIEQERNNKRTLIRVLNYDTYQGFDDEQGTPNEQQKNIKGTAEEQQRNTNNNDKNIKNDKKNNIGEKSTRFIPPTVEEVNAYCRERNNSIDGESFVNFYESKGWYVGKNKMKDWKAAVRTWERKDTNPKKENKFESGTLKHKYNFAELENM